ncbi:hypothetical protein BP5796_08875 [Coleophoma crateriformis]|uniref:Uncharacterized protein n=1 Tax=Coleophoma crateriformis TaxID=565419 RepID=A0A3D8R2P1_9HELO|nr:hypothetical protein BP5796_08875 [Coleophoma crateriformis]
MENTNSEPRRRASAAVCDYDHTSANFKYPGLLEQHLVSELALKRRSRYKRLTRDGVIPITLTLVIFALTASLISLWTIFNRQADGSGKDNLFQSTRVTSGETVGILLHPEDHVHRKPQTLNYDWVVTSGVRSPDGVQKQVYLINGDFPGPTIEARTGDTITVSVTNALDDEGVSIHWHGIHMRGTNHMDGAVGFTQSLIPIGEKFIYEFQVENQDGTFWYHAHSHVQRGDGLYGGLVVHKPREDTAGMKLRDYESEILLLVGDWFHRSAPTMLDWYTSVKGFGNEPVPDSLLINGLGKFDCSMAVAGRPLNCSEEVQLRPIFHSSSSKRLRLVNVGSIAGLSIDIKNAKLDPFQVDGGFDIAGVPSDSVGVVYPGERVDLVIQWEENAKAEGSSLTISLDQEYYSIYFPLQCRRVQSNSFQRNFRYPNPALAPVQSFPALPSPESIKAAPRLPSSAVVSTAFRLQTAYGASSFLYPTIPYAADETLILYAKTLKLSKAANHPMGTINRTSWSPQDPPLIEIPRSAWDDNQLVPFISLPANPTNRLSKDGVWVDIIVNNLDDGSHPFHLHGHDFFVLDSQRSESGWGSYRPATFPPPSSSVEPPLVLNQGPVLRKDTVMVPRRGYVILRFRADNPGIWMFHCHLLVHLGSGMAMGIEVGK